MRDDPRADEARALPIGQVVDRLGLSSLRRTGSELVGPCPVCGGRDRFGVNVRDHVWQCRKCDTGGDGIALVQHVQGCDFAAALAWLVGERDLSLDPEEVERRRQKAEAERERQEKYAERRREEARADARRIWEAAQPAAGTPVVGYLERRGFGPDLLSELPPCLRFIPDRAYLKWDGDARSWTELHKGPCMIAAIQAPDRRLSAVHQTFIDLDRPSGKAEISVGGEALPAKLVRGSKKGGAIRLATPQGAETLVMGEGIETTLSALVAAPLAGAAYWAGVDLGNMGGRRVTGQGMKSAGIPDMDDAEAFLPPPWVRRLVFVQDGDSDPRATRAKLESGLRRAMAIRPGLRGEIVHAGEGRDLNDVLRGVGE